jgi:hypothetical protein
MPGQELSYSQPFPSVALEDVYRGSIQLSAPIENNVIQLGIAKRDDFETTGLAIHRSLRGDISLKRQDGELLQAELVLVNDVDEEGKYITNRAPIFAEPVPDVTFLISKTTKLWRAASEGLVVPNQLHLEFFANTVGISVAKDQRRDYRRARIARLLSRTPVIDS